MSRFARPCAACGRRAAPGQTLCAACAARAPRASSCRLCGARTAGGPWCAAHSAEGERLARQPSRAAYRDPAYVANRTRRYELAGGRCEECGADLSEAAWECDHVVPLRDGGSNLTSNLRVRCRDCHRAKTRADRRRRRHDRET